MAPSWSRTVIGVVALLLTPTFVSAQAEIRQAASPSYRGIDPCPQRCSVTGPNPANWSVYHNFDQLNACQQTLFYEFSLYDRVDDPNSLHRIYACSSYGQDWNSVPKSTKNVLAADTMNATYEIGWSSGGMLAAAGIHNVATQMRDYLSNGFAATNKTVLLFGQFGGASVGLYIGKSLQNEATSSFALQALDANLKTVNSSSVSMQHCELGYDSDHIFGFMATSDGAFKPIQDALKLWANAQCLSFNQTIPVSGPAFFTTPLIISPNATNSTIASSTKARTVSRWKLFSRGDCRTVQVQSGDSCGSLAQKCGVSGVDFMKYNSGSNFCSSLQPLQHVCCSAGALPNFAPKKNSDGSCASYTVQAGDNCAAIAAANSLSLDDLQNFNKGTWAWNGCSNIWTGTRICLSSGTPPMPAPMTGAVCGPQVPGTQLPTDGTAITNLNPCLLNACCDVWGQCGTTTEFCEDTNTGAPGTAKAGTNGCISNCGTNIVRGAAPDVYRKVAYFEGFGLDRPCLFQDASQVDTSEYTHIHFGFATLTPDYQVQTGDILSSYEFTTFKAVKGAKRVLSIGGWTFSTSLDTYFIFRQGVTAANRFKMASNIAQFVKDHDLDGIDIDWEYPGAPDLPNPSNPGSKDDGRNYLAFLVILRHLLPGKSVSIAAPASYWYLKGFPINDIGKVVDYIVYMTYDLHGQWDSGNRWSQEGCQSGMCLRSQVNLTETMNALVMVTKAGVPSGKVVVGVTSYGRSFGMADPNCHGPDCFYTGSALQSSATKGPCTGTSGYISNAEIGDILADPSRVNQNYVDPVSHSNILVYDNSQWVGWMSAEIRATRQKMYQSLNMGGSTNWASDLERYNDPPANVLSWDTFKKAVNDGVEPTTFKYHTGTWSSLTCENTYYVDAPKWTAIEQWDHLGCDDVWQDILASWKDHVNGDTFSGAAARMTGAASDADCGQLGPESSCGISQSCYSVGHPGTALVWNSLVKVNQLYQLWDVAWQDAKGDFSLIFSEFEDKFAPVPKAPNDMWINLLLDAVGFGAGMAVSGLFKIAMAQLPALEKLGTEGLEKAGNMTKTLVGAGMDKAKTYIADGRAKGQWSKEAQDDFAGTMKAYLDDVSDVTAQTLAMLFDGSDTSINVLTSLISNGKLVGSAHSERNNTITPSIKNGIRSTALTNMFAFGIPAVWSASATPAFILDSGYDCGTHDLMYKYATQEVIDLTETCYQGKLYYLATPKGDPTVMRVPPKGIAYPVPNTFSAPAGLSALIVDNQYGNITISDLIIGSLRTYMRNQNKNGADVADSTNPGTIESLLTGDITTPGMMRLPVCSPDVAYAAWNQAGGPDVANPAFPCIPPRGVQDCDTAHSTYQDKTTDSGASVEDCRALIKSLQGTHQSWSADKEDSRVHWGSCKFDYQPDRQDGKIINIGSQDIVDVITEAIARYPHDNGKIAARGQMSCQTRVVNKWASTIWSIW